MPKKQPFSKKPSQKRRGFMLASLGAGSLLLLPRAGMAGELTALTGKLTINGRDADIATPIFAGDTIETGPNAEAVFKINEDAFLLRANSTLKLERKTQFDPLVSGLRMLTGALAVAFGKGPKKIYTRTLTAGIRGTGIYLEAKPDVTYFCTCYGATELATPGDKSSQDRESVTATRHVSRYIYNENKAGSRIVAAPTINHTDEELAMLESLLGRSCPLMEKT
jgi:hypothetical protein